MLREFRVSYDKLKIIDMLSPNDIILHSEEYDKLINEMILPFIGEECTKDLDIALHNAFIKTGINYYVIGDKKPDGTLVIDSIIMVEPGVKTIIYENSITIIRKQSDYAIFSNDDYSKMKVLIYYDTPNKYNEMFD